MRRLLLTVLGLATLGGASSAAAQNRRWTISGSWGSSVGGASRAIHSAMTSGGLNSTSPRACLFGYCAGPTLHPFSLPGGSTGTLAVSYAVRPWWSLRLQTTSADLSATHGYHEPYGYLFLRQAVGSYSILVVPGIEGLRLGAGPAVHRISVLREEAGSSLRSQTRTKIGLTLLAALEVPARKRLFVELSAQSQLVGSGDIGPYVTYDSSATMARTRGSFSYKTVKLGMGVRF